MLRRRLHTHWKTGLIAVLGLFTAFVLGVSSPADQSPVTAFDPANDITVNTAAGAVTVMGVTTGRVEGTSMVPTFWPGDQLLMQPYTGKKQVQEGDIVLYNDSGSRGTHRVVAAYPGQDRLVVKPDNMGRKQEIQYSDIQYVVVGVLWN